MIEALEHEDFPFDQLVAELDLVKDLSRSPLFDVMVVVQEQADQLPYFPNLTTTPFHTPGSMSKYDLTFYFYDMNDYFWLDLEYSTNLFTRPRMERMARHFKNMTENLTGNETPASISILSKEERNQLIYGFNQTEKHVPKNSHFNSLFKQQVQRFPHRTAVVHKGSSLTYAQLDAEAAAFAWRLKTEHGVTPNRVTALDIPTGLPFMTCLLALMKLGSPALLFAPDLPEDRKKILLEDSNAFCLISHSLHGHLTNHFNPLRTIPTCPQPFEPVEGKNALIYFTSGSTGKPKGIALHHRGLSNALLWYRDYFQFDYRDVLPQKTTVGFEDAIYELFLPLICGGTVYLRPEDEINRDPEALVTWLNQIGTTHLQMAPSVYYFLDQTTAIRELNCKLILSGEPIRRLPKRQGEVYNIYGTSECTASSTASKLEPGQAIQIGKPVANTRIYILDFDGSPCPVGVPGRLFIGGIGVSKGYLNVTSNQFQRNPFIEDDWLFETGDLGAWRSDGSLVHQGRADRMVNIRGFRIECAEIENLLLQHSQVFNAFVCAKTDQLGMDHLVGFISPELQNEDLTAWLIERAPLYMIPTVWRFMNHFPTLQSGKLDQNALRNQKFEGSEIADHDEPENEMEARLCQLWKAGLDLDHPAGPNCHFFRNGGHSLKATRLLHSIARECDPSVHIRDIFRAPTPRTFARLLEKRRSETQARQLQTPNLAHYPLSHGQKRIWFMNHLGKDARPNHIPVTLRLDGELNVGRLFEAIHKVVARHEILRTSFGELEGEPQQKVHLDPYFHERYLDHSQVAYLASILDRILWSPFDLKKLPLFRVVLIKTDFNKHILAMSFHHIIADGWSMGVLFNEISDFYSSNTDKPPLSRQYKDFAWLDCKGSFDKEGRAYWRNKLKDPPLPLNLAPDRTRPAKKSDFGGTVEALWEAKILRGLIELAKQHDASLFSVLLAFTRILILRYTQQEDFVIGTPVAGRSTGDLSDQIGFYVNTLALRDCISGDMSGWSLIDQTNRTVEKALEHQDIPFDAIVEDLKIPRDSARSPLFDVMLVLQNNQPVSLKLDGLKVKNCHQPTKLCLFDLVLEFHHSQDGLYLVVEYNTDLFDKPRIIGLSQHLQSIAANLIQEPDKPIGSLSMLTQRDLSLLEWKPDAPPRQNLCELYRNQVNRMSQQTAIVDASGAASYEELMQDIQNMATYLEETHAIGPGSTIGVLANADRWMITTIFAIMETGAAWLPLDPDHPIERILSMLQDAESTLLLTHPSLEILIPIPMDSPKIGPSQGKNFDCKAHHLLPAYVIYTSGSTGKPKGIPISHGSAVNLVSAMEKAVYDDHPKSMREALLAPMVFDACIQQLFCSLLSGRTLFLPPKNVRTDALALLPYLQDNRIDFIDLTPGLLDGLLDVGLGETKISPLVHITLGADVAPPSLLQRFYQRPGNSHTKVSNTYGPTEVCVEATVFTMDTSPKEHQLRIPIGKPIANYGVFIMDPKLRPLPSDVIGEICIAGPGLSWGYLNRPAESATVFTPNPFNTPGYDRLYRTGDLGYYTKHGVFEILGRTDRQIKVRGYRIECAEIEQAMISLFPIRQVVVQMSNDQNLVAWATLTHQTESRTDTWKTALSAKLPDYMIPVRIHFMESMPLTQNNKLDLQALRNLDAGIGHRKNFLPPVTILEKRLAAIWKKELGVAPGLDQNFFETGGHSLKAVKVLVQIRKSTGLTFPLLTLFQNPTIRAFAQVIEARQEESNDMTIFNPNAPLKVFAFPSALGYALEYYDLAGSLGNVNIHAFNFIDKPNPLTLYVERIEEVQPEGLIYLLGYSAGGELARLVAGELLIRGRQIGGLLLADSFPSSKNMSERQIENVVDELLNAPKISQFLSDPSFKQAARNKTKAYITWLSVQPEPTPARIPTYLIALENEEHPARDQYWKKVCKGCLEIHKGKGAHDTLLDPNLNGSLIAALLESRPN